MMKLPGQKLFRYCLLVMTFLFYSTVDKGVNYSVQKSFRTFQNQNAGHKVLIVGIDGCRTDALLAAHSPGFDSLIAHAYVNFNCDRGPYTVSAPGWSTILHGVLPIKHGVTSNSFPTTNYSQYPDVFQYLRRFNPYFTLAVICSWDPFTGITSNESYKQFFPTDIEVKDAAISLLNSCTPDVMLLHFDNVDGHGHQSGFSPTNINYLNAIRRTGDYTNEIMNVIKLREQNLGEQWLVLVVSDHGGVGTTHDNQDAMPETRYVFSIARLPNQSRVDIPTCNNTNIMPTILKYMGVPIDSSMALDGVPIF